MTLAIFILPFLGRILTSLALIPLFGLVIQDQLAVNHWLIPMVSFGEAIFGSTLMLLTGWAAAMTGLALENRASRRLVRINHSGRGDVRARIRNRLVGLGRI